MKQLFKRLVLFALITAILLSATTFVSASTTKICKITINGESMTWKIEPFLAYGPQGNILILIPIENLFAALGYKVVYNPKLARTVFTADKDSEYISFYIDLKTGQIIKEGEKIKEGAVNQVNLINNITYINVSNLEKIAKTFLNDSMIKVDYDYVYTPNEYYIIKYIDFFTIQGNLSSLKIDVSEKYPLHPFTGEQYTKYNTGEWISGSKVKSNFREITLEGLWDGFDNLRFFTGKDEKNELTGKHVAAYAIAWELMDATADEINKYRKQNGLTELIVDHSICFVSVGAKNPKVDSVFDNAVCNLENRTATHTFCGKTIKAECWASVFLRGEQDPETKKYDKSTAVIAKNIAKGWYDSRKGHKEVMMNKKYTTMGVLVIIGDAGITTSSQAYAVFK